MLLSFESEYREIVENGKNSHQAVMPNNSKELLAELVGLEKKKENKNAPLLFNLAELQNECSKLFKISPDETLAVVQELYEKKLVTYPRTDARVLSTAVAKEIHKNIGGLKSLSQFTPFCDEILQSGSHKGIAKTRYVNDKQITDHYAIIPTGQGFSALSGLPLLKKRVYVAIVKRFLSIFYPPAVYQKISLTVKIETESFFASFRVLMEEGYLKVADAGKKKDSGAGGTAESNASGQGTGTAGISPDNALGAGKDSVLNGGNSGVQSEVSKETTVPADAAKGIAPTNSAPSPAEGDSTESVSLGKDFFEVLKELKKGMKFPVNGFTIREGETAPPKRYNSGSMILAMENAGQLIEDEELRAQIKGSGIGTSATRAEILNKLVKIGYLGLNKKTQIITPTQIGEMIFEVVNASIRSLLNAELTASWEKGLTYVAEGTISRDEYQKKLEDFVGKLTNAVKGLGNQGQLNQCFLETAKNY